MVRVGIGFDSHRFAPGRPLVLGGVHVPHSLGLAGHSDADAVAHALTDAILGAAGAGDIGRHFPDSDPRWKGADSLELLAAAHAVVRARGWTLRQADLTIIAEAPRLADHLPAMAAALASRLDVAPEEVSLKAKTNEAMGFVGRGEGLAVLAVATLGAWEAA
ncbi:MAG TPA: 2-C-methyl-D-erythritol 2,4-cyclodiphosphate synthase [Gemmatimonadales bacterium]|nr:2-C-methyl-D-erythritol 2,4-cyclodiphosphate synthase [Gemmatimonadales bacterium]